MGLVPLTVIVFAAAFVSESHAAESVEIVQRTPDVDCVESSKIRRNKWALVHFKSQIDSTSTSGEIGKVLQNSYQVGLPIVARIAEGEILPGWIDGLDGACEGTTTKMIVPPHLGYGDDLTVVFDIEVVQVSDAEIAEPSLFDLLDKDQDGQISLGEFEVYFNTARAEELDENGKPPLGLFIKEDLNQNGFLNWEEFGGPKGTAPPTKGEAIIQQEKADPLLHTRQKNGPLEFVLKADSDKLKEEIAKLQSQTDTDIEKEEL